MPVEIRELIIRAVAMPEQEDADDLADVEHPRQPRISPPDREAIIQECVRQVLRILRREEER